MSLLSKLILAIRSGGLDPVVRSVRYTLFKTLTDRRHLPYEGPGTPQEPGALERVETLPGGAHFYFEQVDLEVQFLAPDMARFTWGPGRPPAPYAIARLEWPAVEARLEPAGEGYHLCSSQLEIQIGSDGRVAVRDRAGSLLREEEPPHRHVSAGDETVGWSHFARLSEDEHLYGLGEQAGALNLRGQFHRLWNSDPGGSYGPGTDPLYMTIPVYLALHAGGSYLLFYENSYAGVIGFGPARLPREALPLPALPKERQPSGLSPLPDDRSVAFFAGGQLRYYFILGTPQQALSRYTELTGRAPLPPAWSLGYHQCRWGYRTEDDIRQVAAGFEEHDLPISAIHLDIDYMRGFRVFTVDPQGFPDLPGLAASLKEKGIRLVTIIDPGVKQDPGFDVMQEGLRRGAFCLLPDGKPMVGLVWPGWTFFPDFTKPEAREWWGAYYPRLLEAGVDGFWHDMNEPTSFTAWGNMCPPVSTLHDLDGCQGNHIEAHNLYALQMNRAAFEALRRQRPDRRPWLISRSGWASQQRYAWKWTGDTESSWAALKMTISTLVGFGLSGFPYNGPDIGGFSGNPEAELYLRAFQMAAFLPFFRTHSAVGTARREPWVYGEPYTGHIRRFLKLRYRLMPLLYTLAWEAAQTGYPLVRPLFWLDLQDRALWDVDDAFLLGDPMLVAPALEPGISQRAVRLPAGRWYDFWTEAAVDGPGEIQAAVKLDDIPVYVRAGAILPMAGEEKALELHIYLPESDGPAAGGLVYSDAGDGYGPWRLDRFHLERQGQTLRLRWESQGDYAFPYVRVALVCHGFAPTRLIVDGQEAQPEAQRVSVTRFETAELITRPSS